MEFVVHAFDSRSSSRKASAHGDIFPGGSLSTDWLVALTRGMVQGKNPFLSVYNLMGKKNIPWFRDVS